MSSRRAAVTAAALLAAVVPAALLSAREVASWDGTTPPRDGPGVPADRPNDRFFADGAQVAVDCGHATTAAMDPIVHPHDPAASHLHDFFGAADVEPDSTGADLVGTSTTCRVRGDTAAYWAPSLLRGGALVEPLGATAYYRVAGGLDPAHIEPYPLGLAAVAGDPDAVHPQDERIATWSCGRSNRLSATPPSCPSESPLNLRVTFPDCWDGEHLDSPDHRGHLAYSGRDGCPRGHDVALPRLTLVVRYPVSGDPADLTLSSGPLTGAHADFLNGWDPRALDREVASCLRRNVVCTISTPARAGG